MFMDKVVFRYQNGNKTRQAGSKPPGAGLRAVLGIVGITLLSAFLLYQSYKSISLTMQKLDIYSQAENDVSTLRLANLELLLESERVKTEFYVEAEGRNRLFLSKGDEYVFIIPGAVGESVYLGDYYSGYLQDDVEVEYKAGFEGWLDFVKEGV